MPSTPRRRRQSPMRINLHQYTDGMLYDLELYSDFFVSASRAVTLRGYLLAFRVRKAFNGHRHHFSETHQMHECFTR